ncbi:unnamed protein product [Closterium sp. NIES-54]
MCGDLEIHPVSVLLPPPESSLIVSSHPITDYYRAARPVVTRVLASLVTDPRASPSSALGCDILEDRQFELEFLAATSPSLYAMLLSHEGDPDALDIPTPCTYHEAMSGQWASQWKAAMD